MVIWNLSKLKNATFENDIVKIIKICKELEESFANLTLDKVFIQNTQKAFNIHS